MAIAAAVAGGLLLVAAVGAFALYPRLGAWAIRTKVLPRIADRLDRTVTVESIVADRGRAVLEDIVISGPDDAAARPLARIARMTIEFDFWATLRGDMRVFAVDIDGAACNLIRRADGADNIRDLVDKLGLGAGEGSAASAGVSEDRPGGLRPGVITMTDGALWLRDERGGFTAEIEDIDAIAELGSPLDLTASDVVMRSDIGPSARAASIHLSAELADPMGTAVVELAGAEVAAHRLVSLSAITGRVTSAGQPGRLAIDLAGSYGGASEPLWTARGWLEPSAGRGSIALAAERFTFDRIDSILRDSVVIDYDKTAIGGQLQLELGDGRLGFDGTLELSGATVFHPMLAAKPVTGIDARGWVQGSFDSRTRALRVDTAEMQLRGVDYRLSGALHLPGGLDSDSGETRAQPRLSARLVIPPLPCQRMLQGIPAAMMPYVTGYRLKGTFDADVRTNIDWADLQASTLDGAIGIFGCKVIDEPEADAETGVLRLQESFTHYVEVEEDQWIDFVIGPDNEDFVPIWDVSHHLTDSLMTTEDSRFYKHRGFIVREFRTALISNLEAGYFRFGASSITMQTVKNVLLYREKTLSRKLQELFLTWHLENRLDKDRIFEIYLNAIEYGPGLYGIGPAARHYFGKHPRDLNPVEAAFFSSILPSPKRRYRQYCDDKLTRWGRSKIARVLKTMHKRGRLTDEEYEIAAVTPLVFDRTEAPPQRECRRMIKRAIKNARPTNPMAR